MLFKSKWSLFQHSLSAVLYRSLRLCFWMLDILFSFKWRRLIASKACGCACVLPGVVHWNKSRLTLTTGDWLGSGLASAMPIFWTWYFGVELRIVDVSVSEQIELYPESDAKLRLELKRLEEEFILLIVQKWKWSDIKWHLVASILVV